MPKRPHLMELARSIRRFGVVHGIGNCARAAAPGRGSTKLWVDVATSVTMHRGTGDWETFSEVFLDECYRDDFTALFGAQRPAESVRAVVDVGANVGYSTIYFRKRYPNASVWAIEPDVNTFAELVRNTGNDAAVRRGHGALWCQHEPLAIDADGSDTNGLRVHPAEGATTNVVQAYTMDDILELIPDHHIDVLKVDVEGAERFVFGADADRWLEHVELILIEIHDWKEPGSSRAYHESLRPFDYDEFPLGGTVGTIIRGRRPATT